MKLLALGVLAFPGLASAAMSLVGYSAVIETFDGYAGSAATVPANITLAGTASHNGFLTSGGSAYNGSNGWYSLNTAGSLADRALGSRAPAGSSYTITLSVANNTGAAIPGVNVSFRTEQYTGADPATSSTIMFSRSLDGTTFDATGLTGDLSTAAVTGSMDQVFAAPLISNRAISYSGAIAQDATAYFRLSFVPGGSGSRAIWGIDDLSVQAVPEPAFLGLAALAIPLLRRRRA